MYGAQAKILPTAHDSKFENDVEMYGAQATSVFHITNIVFENEVEMYGAQAWRLRGSRSL